MARLISSICAMSSRAVLVLEGLRMSVTGVASVVQGKAVDAEKETMQLVEQVRETQAQLASQVAETEAAKQACQQLQVNHHSLTKGRWLPSCATLWQDTS